MSATGKKWLKRIGIGIVVLIVLAFTFATWLLQSESGARFALARAKAAFEGKLDAALAHGALASPLELHDVRYRDPAAGIDVHVSSIKVDYALTQLFSRTLHVNVLDIDGVDVALTSVPTAASAPRPSLQSLLTPPLTILLDHARVSRVSVTQDGKPIFAGDSLDLAAGWTNSALTIRQLALRAPAGKVDLDGELSSYRDLRGTAKLAFDWRLPSRRVAGDADLHNDGTRTTLAARLAQPLAATLDATLNANDDTLPWTLGVSAPAFDARALAHSDSIKTLALKLDGSGNRTHGIVGGNLDVNGHRVLFDPLQFSVTDKVFVVDSLRLRSPDAAGTLNAQGRVQLDAQPVSAEAQLDWTGVELPPDLVGQALATHGSLRASGSADQYAAQGELALGPPGKLADLALELRGTPQAISLQRLALKQKNGGLDAHGEITLQPQTAWVLAAKADKLDPGAFAKEWAGAVDFDLSTKGKVEKAGPAGELQLRRLGGTLRQRALGGSADLRFAAPFNVDGTLALKSGNSSITLRGKSGERTDVAVDLAVASLGDWLPRAGGSVQGNIAAQGAWPKLDARGHLDATKIAFGDTHADTAHLDLDVHDVSAPSGQVHINGKTLSTAGYLFDTFTLDAHGNRDAHALSVDLRGPQLGLTAALNGALATDQRWSGTLSALNVQANDIPPLSLQHPASLGYAGGAFELGELCLAADTSRLCASASQAASGDAQAKFAIAHLPLKTIARIASPDAPLKLDGEIAGDGDVSRSADGALGGHARVSSASGSIAYPDTANEPLLAYKNFDLDAALTPAQSTLKVHGELGDGGHVDGHVTLGASSGGTLPLAGNIEAELGNLGFVDLLSAQTASSKGRLDAKFDIGGTTAVPTLAGHVALADFATEIPAAGIKLHDGRITVQSGDGRTFALDGSIASGSGKLALSGSAGTAADAPLALKITGEDFLTADIPGAQVRISPDLTLARNAGKFTADGSVGIPRADIDLAKLPGGGAATTSPDVVVADAKPASGPASAPLDADITVKFGAGEKLDMDLRQGQEVHLVGFGMNGYLSGQLAVQERPGRAAIGRGQIVVNGTYKAYGQDLKIEQGRLLFAGTPVDNPGLDLRATRSGFSDPDVTVGLQVRGTAQVPVLTVFSTPAMEQSDALSYLVAGKPLSQLKSGEGDAVGSAARALGTAGGDLLAKSIGTKIGLDEVGVADSSAVGGAALTVGKYLSPRLYLSYGVGLFTPGEVVTLRYRLTRLFNIEIQNGTLSSRAGINYKIEK